MPTPPDSPAGDVFVSYAHVDDRKFPDTETGWVTTLVEGYLRGLLVEKLGREENLKLWMDHQLPGNGELTPMILEKVRNSSTILIVLSKGYLDSTWCRDEMQAFLEAARARGSPGTRIFVIEKDEVEAKPPELQDFRGYRFWKKDSADGIPRTLGFPRPDYGRDSEYYRNLQDLAYHLALEIRAREGRPPPLTPGIPRPAPDAATVYLAEVTDDLDTDYAEVKSYLTQGGLHVVPEAWYPRDPAAFGNAALQDLERSCLFVQLLSAAAGKRLAGLPEGYPGLQHRLALERELPVLQWRSADLNTATVADPVHRAILEGVTVSSEGLEEFKHRVVRRATMKAPAASPRPRDRDRFVFVNVLRPDDHELEDQISRALDRASVGYGTPLQSERPADVREHLRLNLLNCDGVILIYGRTPSHWALLQLHESRKILSQRETKPLIGLLEGPPEPKDSLNVRLPNLRLINCRSGLDESALQRFLDDLPVGNDL